MKKIAIITARGGSKRIPKKNIKDFLGKPIISYSILSAIQSNLFDEVMVSTDSEEIKNIAEEFGAKVPFLRSGKNSDDFSTTSDVLLEVVEEYKSLGEEFDFICCLYPTAPFVTEQTLKVSWELLFRKQADALLPVVEFNFPPQRGLLIREGCLEKKNPEYYLTRSQDLDTVYHDAGQFYWLKTTSFLETKELVAGNVIPYERSKLEVQDIDTMEDWQIAEIKYRFMIKDN